MERSCKASERAHTEEAFAATTSRKLRLLPGRFGVFCPMPGMRPTSEWDKEPVARFTEALAPGMEKRKANERALQQPVPPLLPHQMLQMPF